jgi:hypothetical protein
MFGTFKERHVYSEPCLRGTGLLFGTFIERHVYASCQPSLFSRACLEGQTRRACLARLQNGMFTVNLACVELFSCLATPACFERHVWMSRFAQPVWHVEIRTACLQATFHV